MSRDVYNKLAPCDEHKKNMPNEFHMSVGKVLEQFGINLIGEGSLSGGQMSHSCASGSESRPTRISDVSVSKLIQELGALPEDWYKNLYGHVGPLSGTLLSSY